MIYSKSHPGIIFIIQLFQRVGDRPYFKTSETRPVGLSFSGENNFFSPVVQPSENG